MLVITPFLTALSTLLIVQSAPTHQLVDRATSSTCPKYTIINTRGTGEPQGESSGFRTINSRVTAQLSGGSIYNTVYAASFNQISTAGTADIVRKVNGDLASDPSTCFILQGYSQGAAATTDALSQLTGSAFNAVKGVFLIGNPDHKAGLACNVDANGGTTTKGVTGLSGAFSPGIPSNWVSKTLDVCAYGDGVCDTTHGYGINAAHLSYPTSSSVQTLGYNFAVKQLGGSV